MAKDPTKTLTIRRRATREIDRRFNELKKVIRITVKEADGLIVNAEAINDGRFLFVRETDKIKEFDAWLREQIDKEILFVENGGEIADHWLNRSIGEGYNRGAIKARLAAEKALPSLFKIADYSPIANPFHVERAELIFTRAFSDLKGVTDAMATQVSRELGEAIINGESVRKAAKRLEDRVDKIGKTRAKLIARTEIIESHNSAAIREGELIAQETGIQEQYEWITSIDGRERPTHHDRHGKIYDKKTAQSLIGEPNCRCAISLYFEVDKVKF